MHTASCIGCGYLFMARTRAMGSLGLKIRIGLSLYICRIVVQSRDCTYPQILPNIQI